MPRRDLKLRDFGITEHMYRELYEFCLQYTEKKQNYMIATASDRQASRASRAETQTEASQAAMRKSHCLIRRYRNDRAGGRGSGEGRISKPPESGDL